MSEGLKSKGGGRDYVLEESVVRSRGWTLCFSFNIARGTGDRHWPAKRLFSSQLENCRAGRCRYPEAEPVEMVEQR